MSKHKHKVRGRLTILGLMMVLVMASCTTPLKEITYLNNISPNNTYTDGPAPGTYTVRSNDQLYIQVISDDPTSIAFLNLVPPTSYSSTNTNLELITYIVDDEGFIYYPQFGKMEVKGKTVDQIRGDLQVQVDKFLHNASVFVKLVNRSITVLGEVRSPGQHLMVQNMLSVFEAIGTAGDITDFGNRRTVKLIRETPEGKHVAELDLTDPNLVSSPYYYILPHDILYVEPASKVYGRKTMPFGTGASLVFSTISTALLLINYFK